MINKRTVGSRYEEEAAAFLQKQGFQILEKNYRDRDGEIDIIAKENGYLVFVEVKYRSSLRRGYPEEAVDGRKQARIRHAARYYLYQNRLGEDVPCRFDVVSIVGEDVRLIRDAF